MKKKQYRRTPSPAEMREKIYAEADRIEKRQEEYEKKIKKLTEAPPPRPLSSFKKNRLYAEAKELKEKIREMPTRSQMWRPTDENAKKAERFYDNGGRKMMEIYQRNMKLVDPDDPLVRQPERLRRQW